MAVLIILPQMKIIIQGTAELHSQQWDKQYMQYQCFLFYPHNMLCVYAEDQKENNNDTS